MSFPSTSTIATWTVIIGAACAAVRYIYRLVRNAEASQDFVYDMATNHLPHIYDALRLLCVKEAITLGNPPPIQFVDKKKEEKK